jgi:alkylhydroperoxidase family enzyme
MEPRFNMFDNEIGAKFSKRFANASLVIAQSPLPESTQELVGLRASQINGCGWCVDQANCGPAQDHSIRAGAVHVRARLRRP